jgi:glycosyltransferase involved in cell wall biosynthesis
LSAAGPNGAEAPGPRVVIAHDNLRWYGGAERIAATIASAFPEAEFWTVLGHREVARRMGVEDRLRFLLPESETLIRGYRALTPLYPAIIRARRLPEADVLLTSSFAFAHGLRTRNDAPQACYCYSPLRFAWSMTEAYGSELPGGRVAGVALRGFAAAMRAADRRAAARVTDYIAESEYVAGQIERFYGRTSRVIYPPVDCERFRPGSAPHEEYFLLCGRLIEPYKQPTIAVDAFRGLPHRLVVAGDGPALPELRRRAGPNVEFRGHLGDDELIPLMQGCAAAIFPSIDDFGLIPVEVMACGRPVIAFAGGGALETVVAGRTGEFFDHQTAESLAAAVRSFDPSAYDTQAIRAHAERWRRERFVDEIVDQVRRTASREPIQARP